MPLRATFSVTPEIIVEEAEGGLFVELPSGDRGMKLPVSLSKAIREIKGNFVTAGELEKIFAGGTSDHELARRYFLLEIFKKRGFVSERLSLDGKDLMEVIPARQPVAESPDREDFIRLSRFACIRTDRNTLVLESSLGVRRILLIEPLLLTLLHRSATGCHFSEIAAPLPGIDEQAVRELVRVFYSCGFLTMELANGRTQEDTPPQAMWEFQDLLIHARSRAGRNREPIGGTFPFLDRIEPLEVVKPPMSQDVTSLFRPDMEGLAKEDKSFSRVLEDRESIREYSDHPIDVKELGEFLFRSARIKRIEKDERRGGVAFRPFPGGGAIHELEIYPAIKNCSGLESGLYRYNALEHQLERLVGFTEELKSVFRYAESVSHVESAQVALLVTSRFPRIAWKYQSMAYSLTLKNLGCLYQTFYLVATAMELAPCALGNGNSDLFAKITGIDYYSETQIGEFLLGRPY